MKTLLSFVVVAAAALMVSCSGCANKAADAAAAVDTLATEVVVDTTKACCGDSTCTETCCDSTKVCAEEGCKKAE